MFVAVKRIFYFLVILFIAQTAIPQTIELELRSNKKEYIIGEPIILKTIVTNKSSKAFVGTSVSHGLGYEIGFSIFIAFEQEKYIDTLDSKQYLSINRPGIGMDEFFQDRHWIEKTIEAGQTFERLDMWGFKKEGKYKLKSVFTEGDGSKIESKPIEINLLSLERKPDSISKIGDQNFLIRLGKAICDTHYDEYPFTGFGATNEENISQEYIERIISNIIEKCQDSVFREYVMYADILSHHQPETSTQELVDGRKQLALRFEKEYPNSWLLTEIYRKLFNTYIAEKDAVKAEEYLDKALKKAPNATVLRYVRSNGPDMITKLRQETKKAVAYQPPPKKPIGVALPITGAAVAVIAIAGMILFLRKKKHKKSE